MSTSWPRQSDRKAMAAMFGNPDANNDGAPDPAWVRDHLTTIVPPYALFYAGKPVRAITLNKAIAAPVTRALTIVAHRFPDPKQRAVLGIDQFDGCYNFRPKRGAGSLSMHAYAAALDFSARRNPFHARRSDLPEGFVTAFTDEGAEWGNNWSPKSRDPMHFQFARTR
jgi:hypothetical protein